MGLKDKLNENNSLPVELDPSKKRCGPCGIYYDASEPCCPYCKDDEDIHSIMNSYH